MAHFRLKPYPIEAVQWTKRLHLSETPGWIRVAMIADPGTPGSVIRLSNRIQVVDKDGNLLWAEPGDWITYEPVLGLGVCPGGIFELATEPIDAPPVTVP